MLLNMAKTWDDLAKARASQIAQQQRMKDHRRRSRGDDQMNGASIPIDKLNASNDE